MKPASKSLRDYGQYQRLIMVLIFAVSTVYWGLARYYDDPVMGDGEFGPFVMQFKAEIWLAPLSIGAATHLIAQVINGDARLRPWITPFVRTISAAVCAADLLVFSYGGLLAPYFGLYFAYSFAAGILALWFAWLGWGDFKRGIIVGRGANGRQ